MNPKNQFSFCVLTDKCFWVHEFTTDTNLIQNRISELQPSGDFETFNIETVFEEFGKKLVSPKKKENSNEEFEYVYRTIFIYGRPKMVPQWNNNEIPEKFTPCKSNLQK
eukprot:gene5743-9564_t